MIPYCNELPLENSGGLCIVEADCEPPESIEDALLAVELDAAVPNAGNFKEGFVFCDGEVDSPVAICFTGEESLRGVPVVVVVVVVLVIVLVVVMADACSFVCLSWYS